MAGNLKGRLSRLRGLGQCKAAELPRPQPGKPEPVALPPRPRPRGLPTFLEGWDRVDDLVWTRELRFPGRLPLELDLAPFLLGRATGSGAAGPEGGVTAAGAPRARATAASELRFFDLETSGLSGGTGTVAFLAAVGREHEEGFAVRQLFLEDYPGERVFLEALLRELESGVVVTYNGRAFDLPLLRTRCVMNGLAPPSPRDVDVLYCSRRLWRRVHGGASLGLLERGVLGVDREEDVPGSLIPEIWFEYLRRGDHALMGGVLSHNAMDVASLAALMARAARAFAEPRSLAGSDAVDRTGLGRGLVALGRPAEGEELLEAAAADGDEPAGIFLSRRYRRSGRLEDRRRVVAMLPMTFASCVERAKFHEHAERDFRSACEWAERARRLAACSAEEEAVETRLARLGRKLAR